MPNGCWLWSGAIHKDWYGVFFYKGKIWLAHRFVYELVVGHIPDDLEIDHQCHNYDLSCNVSPCLHRKCIRPSHLELATHRLHVRRGRSPHLVSERNVLRGMAKTHCKQGHEYTKENTLFNGRKRKCRACRRAYVNRLNLRKRAAAALYKVAA